MKPSWAFHEQMLKSGNEERFLRKHLIPTVKYGKGHVVLWAKRTVKFAGVYAIKTQFWTKFYKSSNTAIV